MIAAVLALPLLAIVAVSIWTELRTARLRASLPPIVRSAELFTAGDQRNGSALPGAQSVAAPTAQARRRTSTSRPGLTPRSPVGDTAPGSSGASSALRAGPDATGREWLTT